MKNPERDLPKAIVLALGISTVLYILVALAAVSVVGWSELSKSSAPLAIVAAKSLGTNANVLLTAIALASTANTVIILMVSIDVGELDVGHLVETQTCIHEH
jgi:APA family basic amino acid/polyamine antiporter